MFNHERTENTAGCTTLRLGLHVGSMDTDMTASVTAPKSDPALVAKIAIDGIEADLSEMLADERSREVRAALSGGAAALYPT